MNRRTALVALCASAMMVAGLSACAEESSVAVVDLPTSADEVDGVIDTSKVKKSLVVGVDNPYYSYHQDILVAQDRGYFKEFGIENVEIKTIDDPLPALIGGSLDLAILDTDRLVAAAAKAQSDLRLLGVFNGGEANILGVREGIETVEDLKGATLTGGLFGSRNDFLLRRLLRENGVDPDRDVKIVSTGGAGNERFQYVISGTVDGAALQFRHKTPLEEAGGKFLFEESKRTPQAAWAADKLRAESPETIVAFLAAILKARADVTDLTQKDELISFLQSKDFDIPPAYADAWDVEHGPTYFATDGGFTYDELDQFIAEQTEFNLVPEGTDWRDYADLLSHWRAQKAVGLPLRPDPAELG